MTSQTALTYSGGYALSGSLNIIAVGGKIFILTFPDTAHYSGVIPMVFEHSGAGGRRDFDLRSLETHSHYSGVIPIAYRVFDDDSPRGEILTFPDTLTTQGLSLWSLNIRRAPGRGSAVVRGRFAPSRRKLRKPKPRSTVLLDSV